MAVAIIGVIGWAVMVRMGWWSDAPGPLEVRDKLTSFRLPVIGQGSATVSSNELRGRGVLLNFWASWCDPCVAELPLLARLHERYGGLHFTVVGVTDERPEVTAAFLRDNPQPFSTLYDKGGRLRARFGADGLPLTVYIGPDGRVAGMHLGRLAEAEAVKAVERLIILARETQRRGTTEAGQDSTETGKR